ncbi:MAG: ammonium transporter [Armatimonadaceae bacterium]
MKRRFLWVVLGVAAAGLIATVTHAQDGGATATTDEIQKQLASHKVLLDTLWTLLAAFLVFFMQAGFAYVESGLTRAKNANNIMMKNLMDFCLGSLFFWIFGFAIMFGDGSPFMGTSGWLLAGADNSPATGDAYTGVYSSINWSTTPLAVKFMFQLVFAATAATIVSGAMAERTKFASYLVYSAVITAFIYPVVGHWIWGGGWLQTLGMWDFAGSTVVHSTGGWLALAGAIVVGPRLGKFGRDGKPNAIPGHSLPMAALGVFILWLGWFGFNPGSTMAATETIGHIALTTNLAAALGGTTALITSWIVFKKPDVSMTLNGVLGGLVAITAPCAFVTPLSAAIIGAVGGIIVVFSVLAFDKIGVDDPVGAVSVHGVCGFFGTLMVGVFAGGAEGLAGGDAQPPLGLLFGGGLTPLINQLIGAGAVLAWGLGTGFVLFSAIKAVMGLRVTEQEEREGLDVHEHGTSAYPNFETQDTVFGAGTQTGHGGTPSVSPPPAATKPVLET